MPALRACSKCHRRHSPPTGKKCQEDRGEAGQLDAILTAIQGVKDDVAVISQRVEVLESGHEEQQQESEAGSSASANHRQKDNLEKQVNDRMGRLNMLDFEDQRGPRQSSTRGKKSGIVRTAEDIVELDLPWPHYPIYMGLERKAANYLELSPEQFVFGFLDNMERESPDLQPILLDHLKDMMEDAVEYSWPNARAFHGIIMQMMEMNKLTWLDAERIERLRRRYAQRPVSGLAPTIATAPRPTQYCAAFQNGSCQHPTDQAVSSGTYVPTA